jgi:hypothetical protein
MRRKQTRRRSRRATALNRAPGMVAALSLIGYIRGLREPAHISGDISVASFEGQIMNFLVEIEPKRPITSQDLAEISQWLVEDLGHDIDRRTMPGSEGEKDGGLLVGLAIVSTTLTAINTVINVLNRWASKHKPENKVILIYGTGTQTLGELSDSDTLRLSSELEKHKDAEIRVTRLPT